MSLLQTWELRNTAAETLIRIEYQLRDALGSASLEDLVQLLETFSVARSPGPEWSRSFDALIEHLWTWCDPSLLAEAEANFRARGNPWAAVANALVPAHGERVKRRLQHEAVPARVPSFTLG